MFVFARRSLVPEALLRAGAMPVGSSALLLEGDWGVEDAAGLHSLDTAIDAERFAGLDVEAQRLSMQMAEAAARTASFESADDGPNFADINALRLRYEAVRWLRVIAFWREYASGGETNDVELYVSPGRDDEFVALWRAMSRTFGFSLRIHFIRGEGEATSRFETPRNAWWRRTLGRFFANRAVDRDHPSLAAHRPRLLFVGNPRILDPVCDAALDRGAHVAWLYDRFAVGAWRKRRGEGIAWLTCDDDAEEGDGFSASLLREGLSYRDVVLDDVAETWYRRWRRRLGESQTRQWRRIAEHLDSLRPSRIVLDEDATPLARIVVAQAARLGIPTIVIQHGVCCVRFGFAPLAADVFCAWDEGTRRQLRAWGVAEDRIIVTGPTRDQLGMRRAIRTRRSSELSCASDDRPQRVVLLATMPPRDDRPDAVEFHLTTRTYAAMLHAACAAVSELPNAELIVKLHPRASADPLLARMLAQFPHLRHQVVAKVPLADALAAADCVLSCVSSAGIDAVVAGLPVVQLLPQGSGSILPSDWYGLLGSARTLDELRPLLRQALRSRSLADVSTSDDTLDVSAERIVDAVYAAKSPIRDEDSSSISACRRDLHAMEEATHG